jgi:signal peptidase I
MLREGGFQRFDMRLKQLVHSPQSRRIALGLFLVAAAGLFVRGLGTFSVVDGVSMSPTFKPNDVVHARTMHSEVERGDVVIVADDQGDEVIKRIIGLPGESVTLHRGFVYINRLRLTEPYLPKLTYTYKRNQRDEQAISWRLADDEYFVLGDNRLHSADSRHYGPVPRRKLRRVVSTTDTVRPTLSELLLLESGLVIRVNDPRQTSTLPRAPHPSPTLQPAP